MSCVGSSAGIRAIEVGWFDFLVGCMMGCWAMGQEMMEVACGVFGLRGE